MLARFNNLKLLCSPLSKAKNSFREYQIHQNIINTFNLYKFSSKKIDPSTGVEVDQENIKRKIESMKNRAQKGQDVVSSRHKKQPQFMKNYQIRNINQQVKKFRRQTNTDQLFAFEDYSLQTKPINLQITAYNEQLLQINGMKYPHSLIVTPFQVYIWQVTDPKDITINHFDITKILYPKPSHIIIGVNNVSDINNNIIKQLQKQYADVQIVSIFQAISTFNFQSQGQRNVIGFFISA